MLQVRENEMSAQMVWKYCAVAHLRRNIVSEAVCERCFAILLTTQCFGCTRSEERPAGRKTCFAVRIVGNNFVVKFTND